VRQFARPAGSRGIWREMPLVNAIRTRLDERRTAGCRGISRVTAELLAWWERDGRISRLFYAQKEAVDTIISLNEARADFLTGLTIPRDDPGEERRAAGYPGFARRCCKMATDTGKSTVAAVLVAWSILNKQADRGDAVHRYGAGRLSERDDPLPAGRARPAHRRGYLPAEHPIAEQVRTAQCAGSHRHHPHRYRCGARDRYRNAKSDENTWMRQILGTVGKVHWAADPQGRPIYPEGYEDLAKKLDRPLHPLGRDIRCIVSVGMLTEGWNCNAVTHVVGRMPFQSQLLCEQLWGGGCAVGSIIRTMTTDSTRKWHRCSVCRSRWCRSRLPAPAEASAAAAAGSRGAAEGAVHYHSAAGAWLFDRRSQLHCGGLVHGGATGTRSGGHSAAR
jgi:hypothetical protein